MDSRQDPETILSPLTSRMRHTHGEAKRRACDAKDGGSARRNQPRPRRQPRPRPQRLRRPPKAVTGCTCFPTRLVGKAK
jgi:hypothetical protein